MVRTLRCPYEKIWANMCLHVRQAYRVLTHMNEAENEGEQMALKYPFCDALFKMWLFLKSYNMSSDR